MLRPSAAPRPGSAADPRSLREAARAFEAMAIGALLAPMFDTVDPSKGPFGGGAGEAAWRPMLVEHMAKAISRSGGLGLARPIEAALIRMQEDKAR
jgi:Rod binding domain-containing protein